MDPITLVSAVLIFVLVGFTMWKLGWFWKLSRRTRVIAAVAFVIAAVVAGAIKNARGADRRSDVYHLVGPLVAEDVPYLATWLKTAVDPVVIIDSQGGQYEAAVELHRVVQRHGGVTCRVPRLAASGAFGVLQACKVREMHSGAILGTHEPRVTYPGGIDRVTAAAIFSDLESASPVWNRITGSRLKISPQDYESLVRGRDVVLNSAEALKIGAVDRLSDAQ